MKDIFCDICPRACRVDRNAGEKGFCGAGNTATISHIQRHFFEEPPISGKNGSGAIFFGGCNLKCVFCQNKSISRTSEGKELTADALADLFLSVNDCGVHNINLVTPTPHIKVIIKALERVKDRLTIPVVYNTSSYENESVIDALCGLVDIYLPDIKYASDSVSEKYSSAPGYASYAFKALEWMLMQKGRFTVDEDGILKEGTIVRHLCLPSNAKDSEELLRRLSVYLEKYDFRISLMSQYTPDFLGTDAEKFREINRKITTLEYNRILMLSEKLGFDGYFQEKASANKKYTPDFDITKFKESEILKI